MQRYRLVEAAEVDDPRTRGVYDQIASELGLGIVPNLFKAMGVLPGFLEGTWLQFRSVVLHGVLPRTVKEMIGVVISRANGSRYAAEVHLHALSAFGVSGELLDQLVTDHRRAPLPEKQKAMIGLGLAAAVAPRELGDEQLARARALGCSDQEIAEVLATAALFNLINTFTDALSLPVDTP